MPDFKASTQYGDWKGTAAADEQYDALRKLVRDKELIKPGEFLIAVTLHVIERHSYIHALVFEKGDTFESVKKALEEIDGPIPVRDVRVELTTEEFLALFKQFSVVLTWHGLPLEDREYQTTES